MTPWPGLCIVTHQTARNILTELYISIVEIWLIHLVRLSSPGGGWGGGGGGEILPGNLDGVVRPAAGNPCPISDQNM